MSSPSAQDMLLQRIKMMSAHELQALQTGLAQVGSPMETSPGSPADLVWSDMQALGWTRRQKASASADQVVFSVEPKGEKPIAALLDLLRLEAAQTKAHAEKMAALYNQLYPKIVPQIANPVREAGGSPVDMVMMLIGIVAESLNAYALPQARDQLLDMLYTQAKKRLRK